MQMVTLADGSPLELGAELARAGEGTVYLVEAHPEWVAKIFHPHLSDRWAKLAKITAMAAQPPPGAVQSDGFVVLAWPQLVLNGDAGPCGYVMARVDTANAVEIHAVSNPSARTAPPPSAPQWTARLTCDHRGQPVPCRRRSPPC
jgi:eukaryotic-like serine/threonine-protein kinase